MPCSIPRWTGSGARWLASGALPRRVSSLSVQPSPLPGRVGVHITSFEACSSFTRVTACTVAPPPYVGFIARLRPGRLLGSDARKLPSSTNNLLGWVLPPLVICAVEAHPVSPFRDRNRERPKFRVADQLELASGWPDTEHLDTASRQESMRSFTVARFRRPANDGKLGTSA